MNMKNKLCVLAVALAFTASGCDDTNIRASISVAEHNSLERDRERLKKLEILYETLLTEYNMVLEVHHGYQEAIVACMQEKNLFMRLDYWTAIQVACKRVAEWKDGTYFMLHNGKMTKNGDALVNKK
jgi:hypothetical protein